MSINDIGKYFLFMKTNDKQNIMNDLRIIKSENKKNLAVKAKIENVFLYLYT